MIERHIKIKYVSVYTLAVIVALVSHSGFCSKLNQQCKLETPTTVANGKTRVLLGCQTPDLNSSMAIESTIQCSERQGVNEDCAFSSYLVSGAACNTAYPRPGKQPFLRSSLCASSQEDDGLCRRTNNVIEDSSMQPGDLEQLCFVVSCFDPRNCTVNASLNIVIPETSFARVDDVSINEGQSFFDKMFTSTGIILLISTLALITAFILSLLFCKKPSALKRIDEFTDYEKSFTDQKALTHLSLPAIKNERQESVNETMNSINENTQDEKHVWILEKAEDDESVLAPPMLSM